MSVLGKAARAYRDLRVKTLGSEIRARRISSGFRMSIDPGDEMDRSFCLGTYLPQLERMLPQIVRPGAVCVDAGAHKGFVTLLLSRAVGSKGTVLAFEPDPRVRARLQENLRLNRSHNVQVYDCALGSESGVTRFGLSNHLGWSTEFPNSLARETIHEHIMVPVETLDDVLRRAAIEPRAVTFLKVDAEGAEGRILDGMTNLLTAGAPVLFVEINHESLEAAGTSARALQRRFESLGYSIFLLRWQRILGLFPKITLEKAHDLKTQIEVLADVLVVKASESVGSKWSVRQLAGHLRRSQPA